MLSVVFKFTRVALAPPNVELQFHNFNNAPARYYFFSSGCKSSPFLPRKTLHNTVVNFFSYFIIPSTTATAATSIPEEVIFYSVIWERRLAVTNYLTQLHMWCLFGLSLMPSLRHLTFDCLSYMNDNVAIFIFWTIFIKGNDFTLVTLHLYVFFTGVSAYLSNWIAKSIS